MAHRNRWLTYEKWWFSMAMLNNQMANVMIKSNLCVSMCHVCFDSFWQTKMAILATTRTPQKQRYYYYNSYYDWNHGKPFGKPNIDNINNINDINNINNINNREWYKPWCLPWLVNPSLSPWLVFKNTISTSRAMSSSRGHYEVDHRFFLERKEKLRDVANGVEWQRACFSPCVR